MAWRWGAKKVVRLGKLIGVPHEPARAGSSGILHNQIYQFDNHAMSSWRIDFEFLDNFPQGSNASEILLRSKILTLSGILVTFGFKSGAIRQLHDYTCSTIGYVPPPRSDGPVS
jgi:hypothetical protein